MAAVVAHASHIVLHLHYIALSRSPLKGVIDRVPLVIELVLLLIFPISTLRTKVSPQRQRLVPRATLVLMATAYLVSGRLALRPPRLLDVFRLSIVKYHRVLRRDRFVAPHGVLCQEICVVLHGELVCLLITPYSRMGVRLEDHPVLLAALSSCSPITANFSLINL